MKNAFLHRTKLLVGEKGTQQLANTNVILFGVGGVGSWCAEGLVRSGIENLTLVDSDRVCATNVNRQLQATSKTIGDVKVDALKSRLLEINPSANIQTLQKIYSPDSSDSFEIVKYNYVVDAIDSLSNKIHLIETAINLDVPIYSSMGAALKLDAAQIKVDSIWNTQGCPLAREVRKALRKRNVTADFTCVYSKEVLPMQKGDSFCASGDCVCPSGEHGPGDPELVDHEWCSQKAQINGSVVHITAIFGFILSGLIIEDVVEKVTGMKS